jgi:hypothetical protein
MPLTSAACQILDVHAATREGLIGPEAGLRITEALQPEPGGRERSVAFVAVWL